MKCIKCKTDNKLKDRKDNRGRCKSCKHPFTFDPKLADNFTDQFFANQLNAVSVNDSLYFTPRQFYYFLNAKFTRSRGWLLGCGSWVAAIVLFVILANIGLEGFAFLVLLGLLALGIALFIPAVQRKVLPASKATKYDFEQVQKWLERWRANNGALAKLLPPPQTKALPVTLSEEVTSYSFDRAVICDSDEVAHFLIANNFHFENNCAVLSVNGYPKSIFETVLEMLKRNPELKVYALHDANPMGVQLAHRLRHTPRWFAESSGVTIYDLGLVPRQVMKSKTFVLQSADSARQAAALPAEMRDILQPDELKWLAEGKSVVLESLSPMTLLKMLRDGITRSRNPNEADTFVFIGDSGYYGSDVGAYSVDSFG